MYNPTLHTNKVFKDEVKACLGNTFGADTNKHINNILLKNNTRVIALTVHYEHGTFKTRKLFKVLSYVIYTIIERYVCIDYLCTENNNLSEMKLGLSLKTKHEDMDYDNLFGIGIPDIFMNMLSCPYLLVWFSKSVQALIDLIYLFMYLNSQYKRIYQ